MKVTKILIAMLASAFIVTACDPIEDEDLRDKYVTDAGTPITKEALQAAISITQPFPNLDGVVEGDQYIALKNSRPDIGGSWHIEWGGEGSKQSKTLVTDNATVIMESNADYSIYYMGISANQIIKTDPVVVTVTNVFDDWSTYFTGATDHLASHVRQLAGKEFPILLVSEADWVQLEYRATRAGINGFVPCPLFKSRLLGTLAELLGGMGAGEDPAQRELDYSGYRILLVEDIELNQEIAVELLSVTGVQVEVADDGAQAVEKFRNSSEGYYDLIFMDIHMPVMDGYEATRRIRGMDRTDAAAVWIVAMTADAFVEDVRLAKESGMNEHISKPVEPSRLQEILYRQFSG